GSLHVACGGFRATIPGVSAGEFPPVATVNPKTKTVLDKEKIVDALSLVTFAASTDEGRPLLTGVKIKQHDGPTTLAATDGYRLSVKHLAHVTSEDLDLVVPARALLEVSKVSLEEKDVKQIGMIKPGNGQLVFVVGDTEVHTRLIDGEYPNFEKIIPSSHNTRVLLDKEKLSCAVRSAAVFARENANIIKFHIENQTVTVSANTPQVGENQVDVEAKVDGEGGDIAFNSRFLLEFLANYKEEEVLFEMTGSLNSGVFRPVKDDSFLHIIMPVRVSSG
ncbi:DNA polymerase III subunit beta, partial [Candidatus Gottesmanbacteria bacterium RBG_13_45_10]